LFVAISNFHRRRRQFDGCSSLSSSFFFFPPFSRQFFSLIFSIDLIAAPPPRGAKFVCFG
jgi:hypothetical protein